MSGCLRLEEWGRGFLRFGPLVREGSRAEIPTAWVRLPDGAETEWTIDVARLAAHLPGIPSDLRLGLRAFVAWADTCPNPRWILWEQPAAVGAHEFGFVGRSAVPSSPDDGTFLCFIPADDTEVVR